MGIVLVCALAVLVLAHWKGDEWRFILAVPAPIARFLFSRDDNLGVVILAVWSSLVLFAMILAPRLYDGFQRKGGRADSNRQRHRR